MDRIGLGLFKLRLIINMAFAAYAYHLQRPELSLFIAFMFIQFEYLYHMLNLEDKYTSEWERKLKQLIKDRPEASPPSLKKIMKDVKK